MLTELEDILCSFVGTTPAVFRPTFEGGLRPGTTIHIKTQTNEWRIFSVGK